MREAVINARVYDAPPDGHRVGWSHFRSKFLVTRSNSPKKERGMDFWFDVINWGAGYLYEYATQAAVEASARNQDVRLVRYIPGKVLTGCNEFVFRKMPQRCFETT